MGEVTVTQEMLAAKYGSIFPHLDERQRRLLLGAEARALTTAGHPVSADTVDKLLHEQGFSLQGNAKTIEGKRHPDRDAQFRYISGAAKEYLAAGDPVVSVDAKKKEQVGHYAQKGREWRPEGDPVRVRDHDFPDEDLGKVTPYGIYDTGANAGWVNAVTDRDTAAFAVESIRRWWSARGRLDYPAARRLLISADAGGSNGYRTRAWKAGLAALAAETGLEITCCHFPPGTSKWNKIEHRLFSAISMNWRGRPLTSHEVSDQQMAALPITRHGFHGDWNYCLHPRADGTRAGSASRPQQPIGWDRTAL